VEKQHIPKEVLEDLYLNKKLSSLKIANIFNIKHSRTLRKKLEKYDIPRRTISEACTKYKKSELKGNLEAKSYMIGLRAGDIHAKTIHKVIRVQTTTTRKAQLDMMKRVFEKYSNVGIYSFYNKKFGCKQYFIYCDLLPSFQFLLKKPKRIQKWMFDNDRLFYRFLAAYSDCEASWKIVKSHKNSVRFSFSIKTCEKRILNDIGRKLNSLGIISHIYFEYPRGKVTNHGYSYNRDLFNLTIYRKEDIRKLIKMLLPLTCHEEKLLKMKLILDNFDSDWLTTKNALANYRKWFREEQTLQ
jgi:hypothetical protein